MRQNFLSGFVFNNLSALFCNFFFPCVLLQLRNHALHRSLCPVANHLLAGVAGLWAQDLSSGMRRGGSQGERLVSMSARIIIFCRPQLAQAFDYLRVVVICFQSVDGFRGISKIGPLFSYT
jgi:hypothetical protein